MSIDAFRMLLTGNQSLQEPLRCHLPTIASLTLVILKSLFSFVVYPIFVSLKQIGITTYPTFVFLTIFRAVKNIETLKDPW